MHDHSRFPELKYPIACGSGECNRARCRSFLIEVNVLNCRVGIIDVFYNAPTDQILLELKEILKLVVQCSALPLENVDFV